MHGIPLPSFNERVHVKLNFGPDTRLYRDSKNLKSFCSEIAQQEAFLVKVFVYYLNIGLLTISLGLGAKFSRLVQGRPGEM